MEGGEVKRFTFEVTHGLCGAALGRRRQSLNACKGWSKRKIEVARGGERGGGTDAEAHPLAFGAGRGLLGAAWGAGGVAVEGVGGRALGAGGARDAADLRDVQGFLQGAPHARLLRVPLHPVGGRIHLQRFGAKEL